MSDEQEILKQTLINDDVLANEVVQKGADEPPEDVLAKKLNAEKTLRKKKRNKRIMSILGGVGFVYLVMWGLEPFSASIEYGICKTFLELNVTYPTTLHVNELNVLSDGSYRLWFSQIDPFGASRQDSFQCNFAYSPEGMPTLTKVKIGTIFVDKQKIDYFNTAVPYLVANPPDLVYPAPLSDNVANLQFDTSAFTNIKNLAARLPTF